jgi:hypothetical protein
MTSHTLDYAASTVTIRTRAKGLLSKLAHDLELAAKDFDGDVEVTDDQVYGTLRFPARGVQVVGALQNGRVNRSILSASDIADIERRIREELANGSVEVKLEGSRARVQATVTTSRGEQRVSASIRGDGEAAGQGMVSLSLRSLGVKEIKGPLGAFKVDDAVEVAFRIALAAEG